MFLSYSARHCQRRGPRGQRLSAVLRRLAEQVEDRIRIAELTRSFGDRAYGALLLVFAIPNLVPLPPGSSTILGLPLILVAAQLALGRTSLWLPQAVGNRSLAKRELQRVVDYGLPTLRWTERLL
ncbi:MAG TPA: exopolysaccharide biosynthesis protein, partial [Sphingomicrobium sp.]|nr:exopolysaccharide biosynthesis protein [Sphingomicrobium sp.]